MIMNKYYPGEPVNIHIKSLINIMQENNWVITTQKRVGVNYHFFYNRELIITIYGGACKKGIYVEERLFKSNC